MRAMLIVVVLSMACCAAMAQEPQVISVDLKDASLKDAIGEISQKSGAAIVLDPKAEGKVTAKLEGTELTQALNVITKSNGLTWKKLRFAKPEGDKVALDQLKAALLALATVPVVGLSVEDPATKTNCVFAKDLSASPDISAIKLPEGYTWSSAYVILAPETPASQAASAKPGTGSGDVREFSKESSERMVELAGMSPADRKQVFASEWAAQMSMTREARHSLLVDQMSAIFALDSKLQNQLQREVHNAFHEARRRSTNTNRQNQQRGGGR